MWPEGPIVIEGNTRLLYLFRHGVRSVQCLAVTGVADPLPGTPVAPSRALITIKNLTPDKRMANFEYAHFRSVEGAARPLTMA
jgi:hypothetical protein